MCASAGVGTGDEVDRSRVGDQTDSGGEFSVAGGVEDVGSRGAGGDKDVADDFGPVEANDGGANVSTDGFQKAVA